MESVIKRFIVLLVGLGVYACSPDKPAEVPAEKPPEKPDVEIPVLQYSVVATFPHDTTCYTEGLLFHKGKLFESTGAPGHIEYTHSSVGITDLKTGKFDKKVKLDKNLYFGEGICILNDLLYQLTYTNQVGFIYNTKTFDSTGQFGFMNKEGWGMTTDGNQLIYSDGSCNLTFMDPRNFMVTRTLAVTEGGYGLYALNELEYINGFIYANVWMTNRIVKINPDNGEVVASLDLSALTSEVSKKGKMLTELNGIAYEPEKDRILVTGKLWPVIYEISFAH